MKIAGFMACSDGFSPGACLERDRQFEISIPLATEKPRRPHLRMQIEQLTIILPGERHFHDKIAI